MAKTSDPKINFIDRPAERCEEDYAVAIRDMTDYLASVEGIRTIYQVGSVTAAGISDIDMLVIGKPGEVISGDPRNACEADPYLFVHELFGVSENDWADLKRFTFLHNYHLLYGDPPQETGGHLTETQEKELKIQIAFEFLIKMYLVLYIQRCYRLIKLRSFLLEAKALIYDLEFLGTTQGALFDQIHEVIDVRNRWFTRTPDDATVERLVHRVFHALEDYLHEQLTAHTLYLPSEEKINVFGHCQLSPGSSMALQHRGFYLPLPSFLPERKRFNIQHRFNRFSSTLPYRSAPPGSIVMERFKRLSDIKQRGRQCLPGYYTPASSLGIL